MTRRFRLLVLAAVVLASCAGPASAASDEPVFRITSPLGRTGLPGTIRIVARLAPGVGAGDVRVDFYVDELWLASDTDGPPFDALWTDENPYERRELLAVATLPGGPLKDRVVLDPLELTEAAEITSVAVDTSVLDDRGRFVSDLDEGRFELFEDGVSQDLDLAMQEREPGLFTLLVDSSQSMAVRAETVKAVAARLLDALSEQDEVVVAPFARGVTSVTGPTTDRQTVLDAIGAIRHEGGTAILDAIGEVSEALAGTTRRTAVVLITDGYDENSVSDAETALDALRGTGVVLYALGLGGVSGLSLTGEELIGELAGESGGRAWFPRDEAQLVAAYDAIASDVRHSYLLTYTPKNQRRDGTWRRIEVRVRDSDLRVRARPGYTAPTAPPVRAELEFTGVGAGELPLALTRDDLVVLEDGVEQVVDVFQEAVLPVTFMLALDASGSMKRSAEQALAAAREFVLAMRPEDELGLIMFADEAERMHAPTTSREWTLEYLGEYVAEGGTALYDALGEALSNLSEVSGRRVVVVVTDGLDENAPSTGPGSVRTWEEVLGQLEQTDAAVYAVGIGSRVDRARLQELADRSGGAAYFPTDIEALAMNYMKILDELRRRYIIGYESTNRERDGSWRTVDIRHRNPAVEIRSRGGYYAPVR